VASPSPTPTQAGAVGSTVVILDEGSYGYEMLVAGLLAQGLLVALVAALLFVQIGARE
jgi:hypothetical protein